MQDQAQVTGSGEEPDADDRRRVWDLSNDIDWYRNDKTSKDASTTELSIELVPIAGSSGVSTRESTADNAQMQAQHPADQGHQRPAQGPLAPPREQAEPSFDERRKVNRVLEWYHIFFISLSGTLGIGLYVQGGSILRLGGPYVLLFSFAGLSLLAWAVMQGLAEMLCLWPISGALTEFVKSFVDEDLGTAVGIAYWFSYSSGFAAITMTLADEVAFWSADHYLKGFLLLSGVPIILFFVNTLGVKVYAWIELFGGSTKLLFIFVIITSTLGTIIERNNEGESVGSRWHGSHFDASATKNQAFAFLMSFRMAAFAFIGIEIAAATALEAKASTREVAPGAREEGQVIAKRHVPITRLKRPATKVPIVVGFVYILAAIMIALSVDSTDPCLPAQAWTIPGAPPPEVCANPKSDSAFVFAAQSVNWNHFSDVVTAFIVFTAFSAANTQLYVGSRTLFGLTRTSRSAWGVFGRTTRTRRVPLSALLATSVLIGFPFLSYLPAKPKAIIFDVLYTSSSLSCVIVWACECWAFIRFFYCMKRHQDRLNEEITFDPPLTRFLRGDIKYPWISHGQSSHPVMTMMALGGCVFILIPANFACLFSGFNWRPFLSSFAAEILFILVFIYLKYRRRLPFRDWVWLVSLSNYERDVKPVLIRLQAIREKSIPAEEEEGVPAPPDPNINTLSWWGRKRADWF